LFGTTSTSAGRRAANKEKLPDHDAQGEDGKTVTNFYQFRLNGVIITHLKVRPVESETATDRWELVVCHDRLGDFAIDDNEGLADPALTHFVIEVRDATIPPIERRFLPNKGWKRMSTPECIALLESAGVIDNL
jgi:hypothetical protein